MININDKYESLDQNQRKAVHALYNSEDKRDLDCVLSILIKISKYLNSDYSAAQIREVLWTAYRLEAALW